MQSTPLIAFDQHAATTVAAVLLPGQRTPALHTLASRARLRRRRRGVGARRCIDIAALAEPRYGGRGPSIGRAAAEESGMPTLSDHDIPGSLTSCPLCGEPNDCGRVAGLERCWCMTERIPPSTLEQVPTDTRNRVCICRACATKALSPTSQP